MKKTSVYLTEEEVEDLRRAAETTGRSQSELIRDGIRLVLLEAGLRRRRFHSLGQGHGGGAPYAPWNPGDVYKETMGQK